MKHRTHPLMRMLAGLPRPHVSSLLIVAVILVMLGLVALVIVVQQDRINRASARYDTLFSAYTELAADCDQADDCLTDTPSPEVIQAEPGQPGQPGATGATGTSGRDGRDGRDGQDGQDSTTPGPQGAPGESVVGPQGPPGETVVGPQGPAGANGSNGEPPVAWTYTDVLGMQHTCARADPFDPAAPTYTCT